MSGYATGMIADRDKKILELEAELVAVRSQLDRVTELRDKVERAAGRKRIDADRRAVYAWVAQELTLILKANDD